MSTKVILISAIVAMLALTGTQSFATQYRADAQSTAQRGPNGVWKPGVEPCRRGIVYVCQ